MRILYKEYLGSYLKISDSMNSVIHLLNETTLSTRPNKKLGEFVNQQIGIFYDDGPYEQEIDQRAIYGIVIPDNQSTDLTSEIISKQTPYQSCILGIFTKEGFQEREVPQAEVLHGQVPNDEYFYYLLRSQDFMPVLKGNAEDMKNKYLQHMKDQRKCKIEIYERDNIHFYLPLSNIEGFMLSSYEQPNNINKKDQ